MSKHSDPGLSKNKLVSYVHALSGRSYKESRAICKAARWNRDLAVVYSINAESVAEAISQATAALANTVSDALRVVSEAANSLSARFNDLATSLKDCTQLH